MIQRPSSSSLTTTKATTNTSTKTAGTSASPIKQSSTHDNGSSTIREIRSRTFSSATGNATRQLLVNKRQAMSMERLNSSSAALTTSSASMNNINNITDKEKGSPISGSNNSVNGSTASPPSRGSSASSNGGLNRTASRVSRFRSAKAVFERLSSANNTSSSKPEKVSTAERPKSIVASRYAAAAAARGVAGQQSLNSNSSNSLSPRSRAGQKSPLRSPDLNKSSNNGQAQKFTPKSPTKFNPNSTTTNQPKPQPRVINSAISRKNMLTANQTIPNNTPLETNTNKSARTPLNPSSQTKSNPSIPVKPPPKDLIDKIVYEIARDANIEHDADCTIQDLSNCDISGIPEILDFDKCFQDVEMMTEEEARKLLSRKFEQSSSTSTQATNKTTDETDEAHENQAEIDLQDRTNRFNDVETAELLFVDSNKVKSGVAKSSELDSEEQEKIEPPSNSLVPPSNYSIKTKVRFSDEPVAIFDTHAASDYDRRNDDIDPVAASAEYEMEKSKEREGIKDSDDEDDRIGVGAVIEKFNQVSSVPRTSEESRAGFQTPQNVVRGDCHDFSAIFDQQQQQKNAGITPKNLGPNGDDEDEGSRKDYIESLEREVNLKRILEQNLRDLQSQYYETVKQLDSYKDNAEKKISNLEDSLSESNNRFESLQSELIDARQQSNQLEKQLNGIKESSQLLEKKYHRAKRIIKDMQSREESFTRREQLYQQKLDEIEYELAILISTIDKTIHDEGLRYFSFTDNSCPRQHQTRLDVFGLLKQMLDNFNNNEKTQSAQIKQRIVSMLEQHLANLLAASNGCTTMVGPIVPIPPVLPMAKENNSTNNPHPILNNNNNDNGRHNQNYSYASHRLSQPNMPHPIGVGGQPTKIFHGLNSTPIAAPIIEPSPPQSVNSYPSTNSLNSLNNNNQQVINNNNISLMSEQTPGIDLNQSVSNPVTTQATTANDEVFQSRSSDARVPYQTNEWHDKPVSEWTTNQVSTWLLALGLDQYISKFEDRNVNGQSLINLDSTVLKGLGVLNSNDRNLLKKKIRELRVEMEKERKIIEKKMKENLKEKSKTQVQNQSNKQSWKKSLLS